VSAASAPLMLTRSLCLGIRIELCPKDLGSAMETERQLGLPLPLAKAASP
jgi:3-hydroxyisobutyrate dehydrogenase-like beta-hydroxyacid dehydrogenase